MQAKISRYQPHSFFVEEKQGSTPVHISSELIGCYPMQPKTYFMWLSDDGIKYERGSVRFK